VDRHADEVTSSGGRWPRWLIQLYLGLVLYGSSAAMQVRAGFGLDPWDVLHQGLAEITGHQIGTLTIAVGVIVLLAWIPLRQRPGLGTVSNVIVLGAAMNMVLHYLPDQHGYPNRIGLLMSAIVLCGIATGMYISAGLGPGPRDGLMTGISGRTGISLRLTRTAIELTVLGIGWLLGGSVGVGTLLYAVLIGPLSQLFLRVFAIQGIDPVGHGQHRPVAPGIIDRASVDAVLDVDLVQ